MAKIKRLMGRLSTPQVGIAEATGSQAVCAVTEEANRSARVARNRDIFMMNDGSCSWYPINGGVDGAIHRWIAPILHMFKRVMVDFYRVHVKVSKVVERPI